VVDGRTGLLSLDDRGFARALRELLENPGRRAALGREAAAFISSQRSLEAAAGRLRSLLAAL
jgi:glycosyltransferase involved in cell wall biosynthesis